MHRQLRLQYPGAIYHLMSRGNRREKVFLDDVDRQDFIKTLDVALRCIWETSKGANANLHHHMRRPSPLGPGQAQLAI